ncbi:hypothetical protein OZX67_04625 [Bifidobacterium sp. ESL0728]|uniref:hypothetical protein n=1 Tax=Bifidobacterium sp. ESL0728 TaxID=2983220 RepID=UPI0023F95046|nr:hypothetical protein [Bifidobacterium sp. ESL0728]WEV59819.1 hypothetical protein OZX67_04625 [Bifidobacterium sp. ESL0728]
MIQYELLPFSDLIEADGQVKQGWKYQLVYEALQRFECKKSSSVQTFISQKVQAIEESNEGRTYLLTCTGENGTVEVAGFFELCLTSIDFGKMSGKKQKQFKGPYTHLRDNHAGGYCIGELGRSDKYSNNELPGKVILKEARSLIGRSQNVVGGRYALIDARREVFENLYRPAGFKEVATTNVPTEGNMDIVVGVAKVSAWE